MTERSLHVYGIGNAIMDLQVNVSEEQFSEFGLQKSSMSLVEVEQQTKILEAFRGERVHRASGGSAANTIIALAQLGARTAYACVVGDDEFGEAYLHEMAEIGVKTHTQPVNDGVTGTSVILITPDAERTMATHLGISAGLDASQVDADVLGASEWLYIEGYLFASPTAVEAVKQAVAIAKENGVRIAVTCSDAFIVDAFREPLTEVLQESDLVFANLVEAKAYTGAETPEACFSALAEQVPMVALTMSEDGAIVGSSKEQFRIKAPSIVEVDATGAGDMFAGGFLYALTQGVSAEQAGKLACFLGSKVVSQLGPRLAGDVRGLVEQEGVLG